MTNDNVAYIKSHVEDDLELNRGITGRDYSAELGMALKAYLAIPEDGKVLALMGGYGLGDIEEKITRETGKRPFFHESKKCGLKIHQMWIKGDRKGLAEIEKYADELVTKGLE